MFHSFLLALLPLAQAAAITPAVRNPVLAQELAAMVKADQAARFKLIEKMKANSVAAGQGADAEAVAEVDRKNRARLKEIIREHGWPTISLVGRDGAHAAWLLVQHCDADRAFQKECLQLLKAAAEKGDASKQDLAYLTDRVLVGEGRPQLYGTQTKVTDGKAEPFPVAEPEKLEERRAAMGLIPMREYLKQVEAMYGRGK